MNTITLVTIIGGLMAAAGTLGITYAVFRTNLVTRTIGDYKAENEILAQTLARQEKELNGMQAHLTVLEASNAQLKTTFGTAATVKELEVLVRRFEVLLDRMVSRNRADDPPD